MKTFASRADKPALDRMVSWLTGPGPILQNGDVLSWTNPQHRGFPYPEAAALLLRFLALQAGGHHDLRHRVAAALIRSIPHDGGIGKHGNTYPFDSAMALAALLAHTRSGGCTIDGAPETALLGFTVANLHARRAVVAGTATTSDRWSCSYGSHLLKVLVSLREYMAIRDDVHVASLAAALLHDLVPLFDGRRFHINSCSHLTYLHSNCYALEGLVVAGDGARAAHREVIESGARWLADIQAPSGGIHAWHDGELSFGPTRADVTAQAVRIWCCVDEHLFREAIAGGLRYLALLQHESGGLRYEPGSEDVNTWATIFGAQAIEWATSGARPEAMV